MINLELRSLYFAKPYPSPTRDQSFDRETQKKWKSTLDGMANNNKKTWKNILFFSGDGKNLGGRDPFSYTSWWLNQPIWKICANQIALFPLGSGWKWENMFESVPPSGVLIPRNSGTSSPYQEKIHVFNLKLRKTHDSPVFSKLSRSLRRTSRRGSTLAPQDGGSW